MREATGTQASGSAPFAPHLGLVEGFVARVCEESAVDPDPWQKSVLTTLNL